MRGNPVKLTLANDLVDTGAKTKLPLHGGSETLARFEGVRLVVYPGGGGAPEVRKFHLRCCQNFLPCMWRKMCS